MPFDGLAFVTNLYALFLSRNPDQDGLQGYLSALRSGITPDQIVAAFLDSPEFQSRSVRGMAPELATDENSFVEMLYRTVLNRAPDPEGLAHYVQLLMHGLVTRHQVVMMFIQSPELQSKLGSSPARFGEFAGYIAEDLKVFEDFKDMSAQPRQGFVTDFVGSRVRLSSLWNGCEVLDNRVLGVPVPADYHADALEWLGTLKAVAAATEDHFAAMELGAGYGPWLGAGGTAARLRGIKSVALCGVEADRDRFSMMQQNLIDNDLMGHDVTLIQAAVGISDGVVKWPVLPDPRNHAGARPLREGNADDASYLEAFVKSEQMIEVKMVGFDGLLQRQPLWDLVHIDVQGTELELCQECVPRLSERVRYMVVATHSRKLEGELMDLMISAGWILEHEKPARLTPYPKSSSLIQMITHDGTQVWRNPNC